MAAASDCGGRKTLFTVHQPTLFRRVKTAETFIERYGEGQLKTFKCLHGVYIAIVDDGEFVDFIKMINEKGQRRTWVPSNIFRCSWKKIDSCEYPGDDVEFIELFPITTRNGEIGSVSQPSKFREKFGSFFEKNSLIRLERV